MKKKKKKRTPLKALPHTQSAQCDILEKVIGGYRTIQHTHTHTYIRSLHKPNNYKKLVVVVRRRKFYFYFVETFVVNI